MESKEVKPTLVFVDTSAFKALVDSSDDFHQEALKFWDHLSQAQRSIWTTNYILDETYTLLRARLGKEAAFNFRKQLFASWGFKRPQRVLVRDELEAWKYFVKLLGRGTSFTDCTSFAVMKRLGLKEVFTFDRDFARAGFRVLP